MRSTRSGKTKESAKTQAYRLLGVDEADVLMAPAITPLLKRAGVLDRVWVYLETSSDESARLLIGQKYKIERQALRAVVPIEAFCVAAKIETKKVLALIFAEVFSQNQQVAELIAANAQPDIVQATVDRGVEPGGSRERDMLHKHSGFVPVPKTSVTFVRNAARVITGDDNSQAVAVLSPIEKTVRDISDRFNEGLLTAPMAEDEVIDAEECRDE